MIIMTWADVAGELATMTEPRVEAWISDQDPLAWAEAIARRYEEVGNPRFPWMMLQTKASPPLRGGIGPRLLWQNEGDALPPLGDEREYHRRTLQMTVGIQQCGEWLAAFAWHLRRLLGKDPAVMHYDSEDHGFFWEHPAYVPQIEQVLKLRPESLAAFEGTIINKGTGKPTREFVLWYNTNLYDACQQALHEVHSSVYPSVPYSNYGFAPDDRFMKPGYFSGDYMAPNLYPDWDRSGGTKQPMSHKQQLQEWDRQLGTIRSQAGRKMLAVWVPMPGQPFRSAPSGHFTAEMATDLMSICGHHDPEQMIIWFDPKSNVYQGDGLEKMSEVMATAIKAAGIAVETF